MGVFQNNLMGAAAAAASAGGAGFYDHQISNSCRFDAGYLQRTPGSAGNRQVWTFSCWVKKTQNVYMNILDVGSGGDQDSRIRMYWYEDKLSASSANANFNNSTAVYRDTSAWQHVVWKLTGGTSYQYVNGTLASSYSVSGDTAMSNTVQHRIGIDNSTDTSSRFLGYIAEVVFIDGTAHDPDDFAETKNGVWIPKDVSGLTFGSQGYYLKFESSSDLGNDSSGNNNDWSVTSLATHDQMLDSPTFNSDSNGGNFPTYNPLLKPPTGLALSEGNLKATLTSDDNGIMTNWQVPVTGKWYWEVDVDNIAGSHGVYIGVMPANTDLTINQESNNLGLVYYSINGNSILKGTRSSYGATWTTGDIISIAVDRDADTLQFYKNGSGQGTISISTLDEEFFCYMGYTGGSGPCSTILNFGQDGTFAGEVTAGGNSDGTGYGNFKYSVPSGFLAICAGNQPVSDAIDPAETDDDYPQKLFSPLIWTGDGTTSRAITGLGFQPDWLWFKSRSSAFSNRVYDTSRGIGSTGGKRLFSNTTGAETDQTSGQDISAVGTDGFTLGASSNLYTNDTNSGGLQVGWFWRANGGTTSSDASGDITSVGQVDPSGCFSIVTYTGSGTQNQTVAHHLSQAPIAFIAKRRDGTNDWMFTAGTTYMNTRYMYLNDGAAAQTGLYNSGRTFSANAGSSLMTLEGASEMNGSSNTYVAYFFSNCEGYIKIGEYEGNGNADGSFVYTGFKPAFVMVKYVGSGESWVILDNKRDGYNATNKNLRANNEYAESSGSTYDIDFLSNGFKPRTTWEGLNGSGYTIIYLAMAKNPFKYATAR